MSLSIKILSDVICPWCYIGKRRLERAIAALGGNGKVKVQWLPYPLNPTLPTEGISRKEYRIKKFGNWARSLELDATVAANGQVEGIHFAFDRMERTPNTLDAHRLIWLAGQCDCQDAVVESLFQAYFSDGVDISKTANLVNVVVEAGLGRLFVETLLAGNDGMEAIGEATHLSQTHQVDGVPFFIFNDQTTLSGAQPARVFNEAFRQALAT
jgi:predicted DsbA family dithiol-disulfide isomerase